VIDEREWRDAQLYAADKLAAADGQAETFERSGLAVALRDIVEVDRGR